MAELHVFDLYGENWVVAESIDDAIAVDGDLTDLMPGAYDRSQVRQFSDHESKTIRVNGVDETLTCGEWAKRKGRGALCTLDSAQIATAMGAGL